MSGVHTAGISKHRQPAGFLPGMCFFLPGIVFFLPGSSVFANVLDISRFPFLPGIHFFLAVVSVV